MNTQICVGLVVTNWVGGFIHSISQLTLMIPLPFCGPNVLDNFCDVPQVLRLGSTDTSLLEFLIISNSGMLVLILFHLLLTSYSAILVILRSHSGQEEEGSFYLHHSHRRGVYGLCSKHLPLHPALYLLLH